MACTALRLARLFLGDHVQPQHADDKKEQDALQQGYCIQ
jgi:hypothetical protein